MSVILEMIRESRECEESEVVVHVSGHWATYPVIGPISLPGLPTTTAQ